MRAGTISALFCLIHLCFNKSTETVWYSKDHFPKSPKPLKISLHRVSHGISIGNWNTIRYITQEHTAQCSVPIKNKHYALIIWKEINLKSLLNCISKPMIWLWGQLASFPPKNWKCNILITCKMLHSLRAETVSLL